MPTGTSLRETQRARRGHAFYPPKAVMNKIPALYAQDGKGGEAVVHVHYFIGAADWYITELDPETGEAFGWVDMGRGGEWGYVSLPELEAIKVRSILVRAIFVIERDCHWEQVTLKKALAAKGY